MTILEDIKEYEKLITRFSKNERIGLGESIMFYRIAMILKRLESEVTYLMCVDEAHKNKINSKNVDVFNDFEDSDGYMSIDSQGAGR